MWHDSSYSYLRHYIVFQSHIIPKVRCCSLFYDSCVIFLYIISEYAFNINYWKFVSTIRSCSVLYALPRSYISCGIEVMMLWQHVFNITNLQYKYMKGFILDIFSTVHFEQSQTNLDNTIVKILGVCMRIAYFVYYIIIPKCYPYGCLGLVSHFVFVYFIHRHPWHLGCMNNINMSRVYQLHPVVKKIMVNKFYFLFLMITFSYNQYVATNVILQCG